MRIVENRNIMFAIAMCNKFDTSLQKYITLHCQRFYYKIVYLVNKHKHNPMCLCYCLVHIIIIQLLYQFDYYIICRIFWETYKENFIFKIHLLYWFLKNYVKPNKPRDGVQLLWPHNFVSIIHLSILIIFPLLTKEHATYEFHPKCMKLGNNII